MRIEAIQFENFRKYVNTSIEFKKNNDKDIHVVIAENGVGKTTFLNAMTWCLYNEEPKIKNKDDALPTLNTEIINNSHNEYENASVSITVSSDDDSKLIFRRTDVFKIHSIHSDYYKSEGKREEWIKQDFTVTEIINSQSNVYRDPDDCDRHVYSFIPESIKEFFFFDGEQLDSYFLMSSAIKDQVFKLSHIYDLNEMERKLKNKLERLRDEGTPNADSESKLKEYNELYSFFESESKRYSILSDKYDKLVEERDNLMDSLGNAPSLKKIEEKRNKKIKQKEAFIESLKEKKQSLNDIIIKESPKIFAKKAFIKTLELIEENKDDSYIYPIDETILEDSIKEHSCKVCDRTIDETLVDLLKNKKAKLFLISPEDKILNDNKKYFNSFTNVAERYLKNKKKIQKDIKTFEDTIESLDKEIKELYETLELNKDLKKSIDRRDELVNILPGKKSELDSLKNNNNTLENKVEKLHQEYLDLVSKEKDYKDILGKINLCTESLKVISKVKEDMMKDTRNTIQDETNKKFFNLIRKSQTYGSIEINEKYQVVLYDEYGHPASASASASEVELLALAFILAIHSVSSFESPLVVDTLLARISGQQRINVSQSCLNVSEEKQMLLFLIDEEYSEPVRNLFKENHVLEYRLKESESEKQIEIKEM